MTTETGDTFVPDEAISESSKTEETSEVPTKKELVKGLQQLSSLPKKSILKKSNSHTIHSFGIPGVKGFKDDAEMGKKTRTLPLDAENTNYQTVTGAEGRFKSALGKLSKCAGCPKHTVNFFKKSLR